MKYQYYTLGLTLAAMICSCNSDSIIETKEPFNPENLVFNIKVDTPHSITDTRANKTGWSESDRLYMWFDARPNTGSLPDLVLEYHVKIDGNPDKWEPVTNDINVVLSGNGPMASGKVWAYYESHNTGSAFQYETAIVPGHDDYSDPYTISAIPMIAYAWAQDYTYANNALDATLHWYTRTDYNKERALIEEQLGSDYYMHWEQWPDNAAKWLSGVGYTNVEVIIHGMSAEQKSKKWALKCPQFNNIMSVYPGMWSTGINRYTLNVPNPDGPEFYFKNDSQNFGIYDYEFLLLDITDEANPVKYKYTAAQKEWDSQVDYFRIIKLKFGDFTQVVD